MTNRIIEKLIFPCLFVLVCIGCQKDPTTPTIPDTDPVIPGGGSVSGIFTDEIENTIATFLIEPVSGRFTTIEGLSFIASNESFALHFYMPEVTDTGSYYLAYKRDYYIQLFKNGDTTNSQTSGLSVHITSFDAHQNYALISGSFSGNGFYGENNENYFKIEDGNFENIPISNLSLDENYIIYKGEKKELLETKSFMTDKQRIFQFKFEDGSVFASDFLTENNHFAHTRFGSHSVASDLDISDLNTSQNEVSGILKTREEIDLEVHFKEMPYTVFPELDDNQMVMVYNFGEVVVVFDSARYEIRPNSVADVIVGMSGEDKYIQLHRLFNSNDPDPEAGYMPAWNYGYTFLADEIDGYGFIELSPNNSTANIEFGTLGNGAQYKPLCIKGKNIPVEM